MKKVTLPDLLKKKGAAPIVMTTCYDASFARLAENAGIETLLVGDSLGMVIKGEESTLGVALDEVAYHVRAVRHGAPSPFLIADMPFGSYQASVEKGVESAVTLMKAGAEAVKVEGGSEVAPLVERLTSFGIPVVGHVGLTPQYVNLFGGYQRRGKSQAERELIAEGARKLERAGAVMIVLESIPPDLAAAITAELTIPTIGIGAGPATDGQVLVIYDLLGMNGGFNPSFLKKYIDMDRLVTSALEEYRDEVRAGRFPPRRNKS